MLSAEQLTSVEFDGEQNMVLASVKGVVSLNLGTSELWGEAERAQQDEFLSPLGLALLQGSHTDLAASYLIQAHKEGSVIPHADLARAYWLEGSASNALTYIDKAAASDEISAATHQIWRQALKRMTP